GLSTDEDQVQGQDTDTNNTRVNTEDKLDAALGDTGDGQSEWLHDVNLNSSVSGLGVAMAAAPEAAVPEIPGPVPAVAPPPDPAPRRKSSQPAYQPSFNLLDLHEALDLVRQVDPPGVACRDLRDCLLYQLRYHQQQLATHKNGNGE